MEFCIIYAISSRQGATCGWRAAASLAADYIALSLGSQLTQRLFTSLPRCP
jgi:hypothetical protein